MGSLGWGCGGPPSAVTTPASVSAPPTGAAVEPPRTGEVMVLSGDYYFRDAVWLPSGMAVAHTDRALWFLHPDKPDEASILEHEPGASRLFGSLTVARDQDVWAIHSEDATLWFYRGTQALGSVKTPSLVAARLSHDGKLALASEAGDDDVRRTWLIDVETQAVRAKLAGSEGRFSTDGQRVLTDAGVFDVSGQRLHEMVAPDNAPHALSTAWIGAHAVLMGPRSVQVLDTSSGARRRLDLPCRASATPHDVDQEAHRRLIRTCGNRVYVVDFPSLAVTRVPLGEAVRDGYYSYVANTGEGEDFVVTTSSERHGEVHNLVERASKRVTRIEDPEAFALVRNAEGVPVEVNRGECKFSVRGSGLSQWDWCGGPLRKDGAFAVTTDRGTLMIADRRPGGAVSVWGAMQEEISARRKGVSLELRVREHGVDAVMVRRAPSKGQEPVETLQYRLGPSASAEFQPRRASDPEVCHGPTWALWSDGRTSVYRAGDGSNCVCTPEGCQPFMSQSRVVAANSSGLLALRDSWQETVVQRLQLDGTTIVETTLDKPCRAGALAADGRVTLLCADKDGVEMAELVELSGDTLAKTGSRHLEPGEPHGSQLEMVDGELVVRGDGHRAWRARLAPVSCTERCATPGDRVYAWDTFGVWQHADGSVEVAGDAAAAATTLVCRQGSSLRRWSTCREAFTSVGDTRALGKLESPLRR